MFPFLDSCHSPLSINKEIEEENESSIILCSWIVSFDWCAVYQQVGSATVHLTAERNPWKLDNRNLVKTTWWKFPMANVKVSQPKRIFFFILRELSCKTNVHVKTTIINHQSYEHHSQQEGKWQAQNVTQLIDYNVLDWAKREETKPIFCERKMGKINIVKEDHFLDPHINLHDKNVSEIRVLSWLGYTNLSMRMGGGICKQDGLVGPLLFGQIQQFSWHSLPKHSGKPRNIKLGFSIKYFSCPATTNSPENMKAYCLSDSVFAQVHYLTNSFFSLKDIPKISPATWLCAQSIFLNYLLFGVSFPCLKALMTASLSWLLPFLFSSLVFS